MADWAEIRRLAADLQRAQLSGSAQRLSERNCIEIVHRLVELKLLEVIHTTDGKAYLTPNELGKEIREELIIRGGRLNLVDLQQALNVDLSHIEAKVNDLVKNDRSLTLVLGQLIDRSYVDTLCEEIDDKLKENGIVTIAELAKTYDLPGDFISEAVRTRLGHAIKGQIDEFDRNIIYTESYIARHCAKVCGLLSAVTKPVPIQTIVNRYGLQSRIFHAILEKLVSSGRLAGCLTGGRQDKAVYVPDVYTKAQNDWVDSFYKQNGYLEYDAVVRLGITDPKTFIKKRFKNESIEYLESCCVGKMIHDRIDSEVDEALSASSWVDVMPLLPSICSQHDAHQLLNGICRHKPKAIVLCDSIVTSDSFIAGCTKSFESILAAKAEQAARENPSLLLQLRHQEGERRQHPSKTLPVSDTSAPQRDEKKDQRRKKTAGGGGGMQGREVKTKSTKKKNVSRDKNEVDSDEDDSSAHCQEPEIGFMTRDEIAAEMTNQPALAECPPEFIDAIALHIYRPLLNQYREKLNSVFLQTMQGTSVSGSQKKKRAELAEKITELWVSAKLFEKGIKLFDDDVQSHLCRHLLKSICTNIVNTVLIVYATDNMLSLPADQDLTTEARLKLVSEVKDDMARSTLGNLHKSLNAKALDEFFAHMETICSRSYLGIILRKPDKSKERQLVFNHRQSLIEQLRLETDAALTLHIAVILLVQIYTHCMLDAPGRCVPNIVTFLKQHLPAEHHSILVQCQELIVKIQKQTGSDAGDDVSQLEELVPKVKDIALNAQRPLAGAVNEEA